MDLKAMLAARAATRGGSSSAGAPAPAEEVARRRPLLLDAAAAGEGETNAVTSGQLYTWGRNDYGMAQGHLFESKKCRLVHLHSSGRCGLGDTKHRAVPTRVPDLGRVVKVRGGAGHTLAVTADGAAIAFGKVLDHISAQHTTTHSTW